MKSKFIVCVLFTLVAGSTFIIGCDHNTYKDISSSDTVVSSQSDTIPDIVNSTPPNNNTVSSTPVFSEHLGEITDGVFTSTDGIYQIIIPQNINLITATDTTAVFSSDDENTNITILSETNNGQYEDLSQQTLEAIYQQLYTEITVTDFSITADSDKPIAAYLLPVFIMEQQHRYMYIKLSLKSGLLQFRYLLLQIKKILLIC